MAVSKSWYVLSFVLLTRFLNRSAGDETEEIEKSVKTLTSLQQGLATGYDLQDGIPYDDLSPGDLKRLMDDLYGRLECGYLYSAQMHLKLTKGAVFGQAKTRVDPATVEAFSFDAEATMMIDSLLDPKRGRVNDLWLIFVFARQMRVLITRIANGGGQLRSGMLNENKRMVDYVLSAVDERIAGGGCDRENRFNMSYENCEHWPFAAAGQPPRKGCFFSLAKIAQSPHANRECAARAIRANKELLRENFRQNRTNGLLRFTTHQPFSDGCLLLFPSGKAYQLFVEEFLADHSDRVQVEFPGFDFERNLPAVKSHGEFHRRVLGSLEIIMLQIMLSYANGLGESDDFSLDARKFSYQVLDPYQQLMTFRDGTEFDDVYDGFSRCYDDVVECKQFLNVEIVNLIKKITHECRLPQIQSTVTDGDKSLDDILEVGKKFVDKIQNDIGEKPIRLVQSFLKMIDEKLASIQPLRFFFY